MVLRETTSRARRRPGATLTHGRAPAPHRAVIESPRPCVDCGALPTKATLGLPLTVSAACFAGGHDLVMAWVRHGPAPGGGARRLGPAATEPQPAPPPGGAGWRELAMEGRLNDRFVATFTPRRTGPWAFEIVAMVDDYATWLRDLRVRIDAGQPVAMELEDGARLVEEAAGRAQAAPGRRSLGALAAQLRNQRLSPAQRLREAGRTAWVALMRAAADRSPATRSGPWPLLVERELAGFSAWYEMFPRSEGAEPPTSGNLRTAARRLPAIAAMGFDVVYLPPIHPIGRSFRRGPNNSALAGPHDVGSPWAIGGPEGGHTAIHPDLGTAADFRAFVAAAKGHGLEVALDFAVQCSPDHPWVRQHPEWFRHRADGSIRYAENPPKRYQDIYPIDFETRAWRSLWETLRDVVLHWAGEGVRVFRVDNPHTKPFPFWEWLIAEVHRRRPDVVFLAEAFTRPSVMHRLAKIGFSQSYTYFTWRTTKREISEYLTELSRTEEADWFRPNFWVNTPDILHAYLQRGGAPAFRVRAVLAAMTAPSWGMYSGYELAENVAVSDGSEEYLELREVPASPARLGAARQPGPLHHPAQRDPPPPPRGDRPPAHPPSP